MSQLIPKGHENLLEREIAFYERNRTEFLSKHPGRYLLIFGENLEGVFNSETQSHSGSQMRSLPRLLLPRLLPPSLLP